MKTNKLEDHIKSKMKQAEQKAALDKKSTDYLLKVSQSHKGSKLNLLLDKKQIGAASDFISLMKKHGYPGAVKIRLETKVPKQSLNLYEQVNGSKASRSRTKLINSIKWHKLWAGQGYTIGVLTDPSTIFPSPSNASLIYLCSDLKIRCSRSAPVFNGYQTYASGVGTIPIEELDKYELKTGVFEQQSSKDVINFKNQTLPGLLTNLAEVNLL